LSTIVVNWNGGETLLESLARLQRALDGAAHEVVLVDNASADGSAREAARRFPQWRTLFNDRNVGFGAANNQAFAHAQGRYVLILNPDVHLDRSALHTLVDFMESRPQVGACGPKVLESDGRTISPWCARRDPGPLDVFFEYVFLYRLFPRHRIFARYVMGAWDHADSRSVDALSGACLLVRREVVEQVGGFDERFFMYGEDLDLCRRIRRSGWEVCFVADAVVRHEGARSTRQVSDRGARWAVESHVQYFRKWGGSLDVVKARLALSLGCLMRCVAWLVWACLRPRQLRYALSRSAGYLLYVALAWRA
jgi:GT2 family glycosyltransferase